MAKTNGPLMSLSAAGTVAGCMTYRTTAGKQIAQGQTIRRAQPTQAQTENRAAFSECAQHWHTIDTTERDLWAALALRLRLPVFACYAQEWNRQNATAAAPPIIPA